MCPTPDNLLHANGANGSGSANGTDFVKIDEQPNHEAAKAQRDVQTNKKHSGLPRYSDFLSNTSNFKIIESTLREGEQFANAFFDTETKIKIAKRSPTLE